MITGQETPDSATLRSGIGGLGLCRPESRYARGGNTVWQEISGGHDALTRGKYEIPSRAYVGRFNFRGVDQEKRVADSVRRGAQPGAPGKAA